MSSPLILGDLSIVLAHGIGSRSDLPIPVSSAQYGAIAVLFATFALLASRWRDSRFEAADQSRNKEAGAVDNALTRQIGPALGVLGLVAFCAVAAFGSDNSAENPAPTWLYVWLWVGLVPLSLIFGPVVRYLNPFRAITGVLRPITQRVGLHSTEYPDRWGRWPAALGLAVFVWIELVKADRDQPSTVLSYVIAYSLVQIFGGLRFGERWHSHADPFEVYSALISHLSPFWRRSGQTRRPINPFRQLATLRVGAGTAAVLYVLLGSTAFDGLTRTRFWNQWVGDTTGVALDGLGTVGLLACILGVAGLFRLACWMTRVSMRERNYQTTQRVQDAFAHSLIPIVIGYTVAHYFSLVIFQGQAGFLLASDPLTNGSNFFSVDDARINYSAVSTAVIAWVQVAAILLGHVVGVIAAHDRALGVLRAADKRSGQYPIIACMVVFTFGGIGFLLGA